MADLHLHTALSPCASPDMTPPRIAREAVGQGLALIAVCDHNSCGNAGAVAGAVAGAMAGAGGGGLAVIPGMEITTSEEVHVLGLFPSLAAAEEAGRRVQAGLPAWAPPRGCTQQRLLDAEGRIVGYESHLLAGSSGLSLAETVALIRSLGGLAVASHVDRRSFSVVSQLGFLPAEVRFDALEISAAGAARGRAAEFLAAGLPLLCSSDGHSPEEVGAGRTVLYAEQASFAELALALQGQAGRSCGIA
jgi:PHP family Zn ribbon phosphoesterase